MKNILSFSPEKARNFFLKQESYFNFDLPPYFTFKTLLDSLSEAMEDVPVENFYMNFDPEKGKVRAPFPSDYDDVNYTLLNNKDGKFAWRPFQLIHPALYVALTHKITQEENWNLILQRFTEFQSNEKIKCHSLPFESESDLSDKAAAISNWWHNIEQASLELALRFEFVLHTDIYNCYGSIYTHSIPWALHGKQIAKKNRGASYIGNCIDKFLRDMSYGQTNGIPQGSALMDLVAEIVLGYVDLILTRKIESAKIVDYAILRYRDDYRVFTNNPRDAEEIAKYLTEILIELGMRLNAQKTMVSDNIIRDSIRADKRYWNAAKRSAKNLQSHLLLIHKLSAEYHNSGSLSRALDKFLHRLQRMEGSKENLRVLISILIDIAYRNPRTYPVVCAILSKFMSLIDDTNEQNNIMQLVKQRFSRIPNTGHIKIWLQRVTVKTDRYIEYDERLCQKLNNNEIRIWNSEWLNEELQRIIDAAILVDEGVINAIHQVIGPDEISLFDY